MKQRLHIKRADEEIIRCNVEVRRLYTHIHDEKRRHDSVLHKLVEGSDPLFSCVEEYCTRRQHINNYLLGQIQCIFNMPGFSGDHTVGCRIGGQPPSDLGAQACPNTVLPKETAISDDEDDNDEENAQVGGLLNFIGSLTLT